MLNSPQEVLECLKAGNFEGLLGLVESAWFEAKQSPYVFTGDRQKLELAKDISALANAGGGILVIGFVTGQKPTLPGDRVERVSPFTLSMVNSDQIRKLLAEWVHPSLEKVDVQVFECKNDPGKGVAAIVVEDAVTGPGKPYLVAKMLNESDGVIGTQFGYFERIQDRVPTTSVARLHQLISAGQSFSAIQERLMSMESAIASLKLPAAKPLEGGVTRHEVEQRVLQAIAATERTGRPIVYFSAAAQDDCDFPTLFESASQRVVRLIESPPRLRPEGFSLMANEVSVIIEGRLRRCVRRSSRLIELWKDGELNFVGPGDEDFLGWFGGWGSNDPIKINNFVLAETILLFCWLTQLIFTEADPRPKVLRLTVGFRDLMRAGKPALIDDIPFRGMNVLDGPKSAPDGKHEVSEFASWEDFDPEKIGYALFKSIYNWFGYESRSIPYIDREGQEPKLSTQTLTGKPLPLPSEVETPQW